MFLDKSCVTRAYRQNRLVLPIQTFLSGIRDIFLLSHLAGIRGLDRSVVPVYQGPMGEGRGQTQLIFLVFTFWILIIDTLTHTSKRCPPKKPGVPG